MGLGSRCSRAVVRLHRGEEQGRFSAWLRIPVRRHPGRDGFRKIRQKLHDKLESVLLAVGGEVIRFGVRRLRPKTVLSLEHPETIPLRLTPSQDLGREAPRVESQPTLVAQTAAR